ncbi:hypothetical protein FB451DRAFT_1392003 [Mycena latifolia]|nr:hypothetical protein FB451DRAFT_1392003 [Mycena latifolia]
MPLESEITQMHTQLGAALEASRYSPIASGAHHERSMANKSIGTEFSAAAAAASSFDQAVQDEVGRQTEGISNRVNGINDQFDKCFKELAADDITGDCVQLLFVLLLLSAALGAAILRLLGIHFILRRLSTFCSFIIGVDAVS